MGEPPYLLRGMVEHPRDNNLTEKSLLEMMKAMQAPLCAKPSQLVVSQEGLERMRALCADDPEFRKRVLAEFPQLEGVI